IAVSTVRVILGTCVVVNLTSHRVSEYHICIKLFVGKSGRKSSKEFGSICTHLNLVGLSIFFCQLTNNLTICIFYCAVPLWRSCLWVNACPFRDIPCVGISTFAKDSVG